MQLPCVRPWDGAAFESLSLGHRASAGQVQLLSAESVPQTSTSKPRHTRPAVILTKQQVMSDTLLEETAGSNCHGQPELAHSLAPYHAAPKTHPGPRPSGRAHWLGDRTAPLGSSSAMGCWRLCSSSASSGCSHWKDSASRCQVVFSQACVSETAITLGLAQAEQWLALKFGIK